MRERSGQRDRENDGKKNREDRITATNRDRKGNNIASETDNAQQMTETD